MPTRKSAPRRETTVRRTRKAPARKAPARNPLRSAYVRSAAEAAVAARRARATGTFTDPISMAEVPARHGVEINKQMYDPRGLKTWANAKGTVPHSRRALTRDEMNHIQHMARLANGHEGYGTLDFSKKPNGRGLVGLIVTSLKHGFQGWERAASERGLKYFAHRGTYKGLDVELRGYTSVFRNDGKPAAVMVYRDDGTDSGKLIDVWRRKYVMVWKDHARSARELEIIADLAKALASALHTKVVWQRYTGARRDRE